MEIDLGNTDPDEVNNKYIKTSVALANVSVSWFPLVYVFSDRPPITPFPQQKQ